MDISLFLGYLKAFLQEFGLYDVFSAGLGTMLILGVVFYVIRAFRQ